MLTAHFAYLPDDLFFRILRLLPRLCDHCRLGGVCSSWRHIILRRPFLCLPRNLDAIYKFGEPPLLGHDVDKKITDSCFACIMTSLPGLCALDLSDRPKLVQAIGSVPALAASFRHMQVLRLSACHLTDQHCTHIGDGMPELQMVRTCLFRRSARSSPGRRLRKPSAYRCHASSTRSLSLSCCSARERVPAHDRWNAR